MNVLVLMSVVTACRAATIAEMALKLNGSTFAFLSHHSGIISTLHSGGPFTVFMPTDAAFAKMPNITQNTLMQDIKLLQTVLKYHIIAGNHRSSDFSNDDVIPSWNPGSKVRINFYGSIMTATGSKVISRDHVVSNGIIHLIDEVMYPIPDLDVIQECAGRPQLTQLVYSLVRANLQNDLIGGPFTVFAPTDAGFDALPTGFLNTEFLTIDKSRNLMEYHYTKGTFYSVGLNDGQKIQTSQGTDIIIHQMNGKMMVNNATVIEADIKVTNGVVHIIDQVLVPSKHMDLANAVDAIGK